MNLKVYPIFKDQHINFLEHPTEALLEICDENKLGVGTGCLIGKNLLLAPMSIIPPSDNCKRYQAIFFKIHPNPDIEKNLSYHSLRIIGRFFDRSTLPLQQQTAPDSNHFDIFILEENAALASVSSKITPLFKQKTDRFLTNASPAYFLQFQGIQGEDFTISPVFLERFNAEIKENQHRRHKHIKPQQVDYRTYKPIQDSGGVLADLTGNVIALYLSSPAQSSTPTDGDSFYYQGLLIDQVRRVLKQLLKHKEDGPWWKERLGITDHGSSTIILSTPMPSLTSTSSSSTEVSSPDHEFFIGRKKELKTLIKNFRCKRKIALTGPVGIGKTWMAEFYLHQLRWHPQKFNRIKRIRSDDRTTLECDLQHFAKELDVHIEGAWKKRLVNRLEREPSCTLLVFDGVNDPSMLEELQSIFPDNECIYVLITTRLQTISSRYDFEEILLRPFSEEESLTLVTRYHNSQDRAKEESSFFLASYYLQNRIKIASIAKNLGYHPQIVDNILSCLRNITVDECLNYSIKNPLFLLNASNLEKWNEHIQLFKRHPRHSLGWKILKFLSGSHFQIIPLKVIDELFKKNSRQQLHTALKLLTNFSLIEISSSSGCTLHPILRQLVIDQLTPGECDQYLEKSLKCFVRFVDDFNLEDLEKRGWFKSLCLAFTPIIERVSYPSFSQASSSTNNDNHTKLNIILWLFKHYSLGHARIPDDKQDQEAEDLLRNQIIEMLDASSKKSKMSHPTLFECVLAAKLAHFCIEHSTKRNEDNCNPLIIAKLDPNDEHILPMTAAYLSNFGETYQLQQFFNNLFYKFDNSKESDEIFLIAQCFEACKNPGQFSQYPEFLTTCSDTIPGSSRFMLKLISQNTYLLDYPVIISKVLPRIKVLSRKSDKCFSIKRREKLILILLFILNEHIRKYKKFFFQPDHNITSVISTVLDLINSHMNHIKTISSKIKQLIICSIENLIHCGEFLFPKHISRIIFRMHNDADPKVRKNARHLVTPSLSIDSPPFTSPDPFPDTSFSTISLMRRYPRRLSRSSSFSSQKHSRSPSFSPGGTRSLSFSFHRRSSSPSSSSQRRSSSPSSSSQRRSSSPSSSSQRRSSSPSSSSQKRSFSPPSHGRRSSSSSISLPSISGDNSINDSVVLESHDLESTNSEERSHFSLNRSRTFETLSELLRKCRDLRNLKATDP